MKALITMREDTNSYGEKIDILEHSYVKFWSNKMNFNVIPVSNLSCISEKMVSGVDLIIFTGGGSVSSGFFSPNEKRKEQPNRDIVERELLEYAMNLDIPLIGICRGMQYINCLFGGGISSLNNGHAVGTEHDLFTKEGMHYVVNSYHNDGIYCAQLSKKLEPIAYDESMTIVEAFKHRTNRIIGIQWHPERKMKDEASLTYSISLMRGIFER